jgi:hypothetical protein
MTAGIGSIGSLDTSLEVELHHASLNIPGSISQLLHKAGPSNELANMDLFRTFAVLLVFIGHLFVFLRIRGLGDIGHLGVLFFFVHTSLVLVLSMDRLGLTDSSLYGVFLLRRVFRIYPLSVLGVVVALALHVPSAPWLGGYVFPGWYAVLSNILLIQNIAGDGSIICASGQFAHHRNFSGARIGTRRFSSLPLHRTPGHSTRKAAQHSLHHDWFSRLRS